MRAENDRRALLGVVAATALFSAATEAAGTAPVTLECTVTLTSTWSGPYTEPGTSTDSQGTWIIAFDQRAQSVDARQIQFSGYGDQIWYRAPSDVRINETTIEFCVRTWGCNIDWSESGSEFTYRSSPITIDRTSGRLHMGTNHWLTTELSSLNRSIYDGSCRPYVAPTQQF